MVEDARRLALEALARERDRRLMETAARMENAPPTKAIFVGYDCKTGEALVRPLGGGIVRCQPIYNTAVRPGDIIDLHVSQGIPKGDNLSAFEPETPEVLEPEPEIFGKLKILFYTPDGGLWIGGDRRVPRRVGQWEASRSWKLTNLGTGENNFVVAGVNQSASTQIVRYGQGGSVAIVNESPGTPEINNLLGGAAYSSHTSPRMPSLIGKSAGEIAEYGQASPTLYSRTVTGSMVQDNDGLRSGNASENFTPVVWWHNGTTSGEYSASASYVEGKDGPFTTVLVNQRTAGGVISAGVEIPIKFNFDSPSGSTNIDFAQVFLLFAGLDRTTIYRRDVLIIQDSVTIESSTAFYSNDQVIPKLADLPFGSKLIITDGRYWAAKPLGESTCDVDVYAVATGDKVETITTPFHPIPSEATIIDWSYHP